MFLFFIPSKIYFKKSIILGILTILSSLKGKNFSFFSLVTKLGAIARASNKKYVDM